MTPADNIVQFVATESADILMDEARQVITEHVATLAHCPALNTIIEQLVDEAGLDPAAASSAVSALVHPVLKETTRALSPPRRAPLRSRLSNSSTNRFVGEPPVMKFRVEGMLPQTGTGMLSGATTIGKSMFLLEMSACVATGVDFLRKETEMCPVLFVTAEDDEAEVHRRYYDIKEWIRGFNPYRWSDIEVALATNLHVVSTVGMNARLTMREAKTWNLSGVVDDIIERALAIGAKVVIIDPLSRFRSSSMNDDEEAVVIVMALERIAQAIDGLALLSGHVTKATSASGRDGIYSHAGTSTIENGLRWAAVLRAPNDAEAKLYGWDDTQRGRYVTFSGPKFSNAEKFERMWLKRDGRLLLLHDAKTPKQDSRDAEYQRIAPLLVDIVKRARLNNEQPTRKELVRKHANPAGVLACSEHTLKWVMDDALDDGKLILVAFDKPKKGGAKEYISAP